MDLLLAAFVQTLLGILRACLFLSLLACLALALGFAVTAWNVHREEKRQRQFARKRQMHQELLAAERRREEEIRVRGRLPRDGAGVERRAS